MSKLHKLIWEKNYDHLMSILDHYGTNEILNCVDKNGMTVYRFMKDSAWPMKTACTGACLEKWPVVAPVDKNDTEGILKKGFVTFDRPDGIKQQTIDCWPIYTFAGDKKPGDTNGQGVGGTWFAVSPQGKPVGAPK